MARFIIMLALGWVAATLAVAVGVAFGLGARHRAARLLDRWTAPFQRQRVARIRPDVPPAVPQPRSSGASDQVAVSPDDGFGLGARSGTDRRRVSRPGPDRRDLSGNGSPAA